LTIERAAFGGDVLGYLDDGRVAFVRGAAPGDVVTARLTNVRKKYVKGRIVEVKSGGRGVAPFCDVFAECGGCPWQGIGIADQRATLQAHIQRSFGPLMADEGTLLDMRTFETESWRATARLHFDGAVVGFRGFGSHRIVDVEHCPIFTSILDSILDHLRNTFSQVPARGTARITADLNANTGTIFLECEDKPGIQGAALATALLDHSAVHGVSLKYRDKHWVQGHPFNELGPRKIRHAAHGFVQAHQSGNRALVETVVGTLASSQHCLELYAGSGNFTLPLLAAGQRVTTVEVDAEAVDSVRTSADSQGLGAGLTVHCGRAETLVVGDFDALLVDPPRAGMPNIAEVASHHPFRSLVYVSCNPASLARDIRTLLATNWSLKYIEPYDLFPHTGHVEVLAVLDREN